MTDTPSSSPDAAAVEAVKQMYMQALLCHHEVVGAMAAAREHAARIITEAYMQQTKRLSRTVKIICDARRFIEAETVHHADISLNDWIQEKLDRLTAERAVRERLVEAVRLDANRPDITPRFRGWLEAIIAAAENLDEENKVQVTP